MIDERKQDHLDICIREKVESGDAGFGRVRLVYEALPEVDFDKINTETKFLGKKLKYPIIINAMTGGTKSSTKINRDIAEVAQEYGIGFGVGSQRAAIENPTLEETFNVKDSAPDLPLLIANLGAVQLNYGYGVKECKKAVEMINADALALHINPLQEVLQPEGNKNFSNLIAKINKMAKELKTPVIAKCVGEGMTQKTAKKLKVSAIDISGVGGTCWSLVESYRSQGAYQKAGVEMSGWGIPTAEAIQQVAKLKTPLIGSGGIRTGMDAAKAIALGADVVGISLPVLKAWYMGSRDGVRAYLDRFTLELKIAMFLTGSKEIKNLRGKVE
ncbi:MAG: type 2 isopentenyl-diphosphate Delta-isomerase [Candidatus Altiarchaeota archaeon]